LAGCLVVLLLLQASDTAYQFAKAAIAKGHEIFRVFFYHDGVDNASRFTIPPQDDRNVVNNWASLDIKNADGEPELVVCVAAALRRGMLDEGEAGKNGVDGNNRKTHGKSRVLLQSLL
jgi:tRNA 2-thiouridine synthesizing protein D